MSARIAALLAPLATALIALAGCAPPPPVKAASAPETPLEARRKAACASLASDAAPTFTDVPTASLPEGERIVEIALRGARTVPASAVREIMKTQVGERVAGATLDEDLARIHRLGVFEDVRLAWEKRASGLAIVVEVDERPFVGAVFFAPGVSAPEAGQWRPPLPGDLYDPAATTRALRALERNWKGAGYADARADVRARRVDAEHVDLCFDVDHGPKWIVERLAWLGAARVSDGELSAVMGTRDGEFNAVGKPLREDWLRDDPARLKGLYYDRGYLRVEVSPPQITRDPARHAATVVFSISEGLAYRISTIDIRGKLAGPRGAYAALLAQAPGQLFSRTKMLETLDKLRRLHGSLTKKEAKVEPDLSLHDDRGTVDVVLRVGGS